MKTNETQIHEHAPRTLHFLAAALVVVSMLLPATPAAAQWIPCLSDPLDLTKSKVYLPTIPELVYGVVDISAYTAATAVSYRAQQHQLYRYLRGEKEKIAHNLKTLDSLQYEPSKIPVELFPLFRKMDVEKDPGR